MILGKNLFYDKLHLHTAKGSFFYYPSHQNFGSDVDGKGIKPTSCFIIEEFHTRHSLVCTIFSSPSDDKLSNLFSGAKIAFRE